MERVTCAMCCAMPAWMSALCVRIKSASECTNRAHCSGRDLDLCTEQFQRQRVLRCDRHERRDVDQHAAVARDVNRLHVQLCGALVKSVRFLRCGKVLEKILAHQQCTGCMHEAHQHCTERGRLADVVLGKVVERAAEAVGTQRRITRKHNVRARERKTHPRVGAPVFCAKKTDAAIGVQVVRDVAVCQRRCARCRRQRTIRTRA